MVVIKNQRASSAMQDAIVLDLGDVAKQAARIRQSAEEQARKMLREAEQNASIQSTKILAESSEKGRVEGYAKGYEEGQATGREEARQATTEVFEKIQKGWIEAAAQWDEQRAEMHRQARQSVLDLALALGRKLVHRKIETDPNVVVDQVTHALEHVMKPQEVKVQINPGDRPVMQEALPDLINAFSRFKHIQLEDDESVDRGGCAIRFGSGSIDAKIQTQLRNISELLVPSGPG